VLSPDQVALIVQLPGASGVQVTEHWLPPVVIGHVGCETNCVSDCPLGPVPLQAMVEALDVLNASVAVSVALLPAIGEAGSLEIERLPVETVTVI
jgi:hypothetical protein